MLTHLLAEVGWAQDIPVATLADSRRAPKIKVNSTTVCEQIVCYLPCECPLRHAGRLGLDGVRYVLIGDDLQLGPAILQLRVDERRVGHHIITQVPQALHDLWTYALA